MGLVDIVQKKKVEIHVSSEEYRKTVGFIERPLKQNHINYTVVVDKPPCNRGYPYLTVNTRVLCLRRTLNEVRGCVTE